MLKLRYVKGNLIKLALKDYFDVILHGCNCFCTMGAGIAKDIKHHFPAAYLADQETQSGDISKLGQYTSAQYKTLTHNPLIVINAYTQFKYGRDRVQCDYTAIEKVLSQINKDFGISHRIGMPKIGCGLAGGNWTIVEGIIQKVMTGDVTVVEYNHKQF